MFRACLKWWWFLGVPLWVNHLKNAAGSPIWQGWPALSAPAETVCRVEEHQHMCQLCVSNAVVLAISTHWASLEKSEGGEPLGANCVSTVVAYWTQSLHKSCNPDQHTKLTRNIKLILFGQGYEVPGRRRCPIARALDKEGFTAYMPTTTDA